MASNIPHEALLIQNEIFDQICHKFSDYEHKRLAWMFKDIPLDPADCDFYSRDPCLLLGKLLKCGVISPGDYSKIIEKLGNIKPDFIPYLEEKAKKIQEILGKANEDETSIRTPQTGPTEDFQAKENNYKLSMKKTTRTQNINLTFTGHVRAGKTCLMRQLLRKDIKPGGPDRTNLAQLLAKRVKYILGKKAKERERIERGKEAEMCRLRLRRLKKKRENTEHIIYQRNDSVDSGSSDMESTEPDESYSDSSGEQIRELGSSRRDETTSQMTEDQLRSVEDINKEDDEIDDSSVAYVTLFDFGGEEVFRNCQQCIMSANSVFLLVFDASLFEREQDDVIDDIVFWLNLIATNARDERTPPIILIGSHMDKVETDEETICDQLDQKLKEKPGIRDIYKHHVQQIMFIPNMDNSSRNEEMYLDLWCEIEKCAPLQSFWHHTISGSWLALEEKVLLEKEKGVKFLNIRQILDINNQLLVPLQQNEIVPFIRYMHATQSIFCFDIVEGEEKFLSEEDQTQVNVILDINWILEAFGAIITTDDFVKFTGHKQRLSWKQFKATAILTDEILDLRWSNVSDENRSVLISALETLGLITKRDGASESSNQSNIRQSYIVPCLLGEASPKRIQELLNNSRIHCTKTLCLKLEKKFVPQAVWDRMTAICIHEFDECPYPETGKKRTKSDYLCPKRGLICRSYDDVWNFVLHCKGSMLKLTMFTYQESCVSHGVGKDLTLRMNDILESCLSTANQGTISYYLDCDFWISDGESYDRKPNEKTWERCTEFRVKDSEGKECLLTRDDWQAWFGDVNQVSTTPKFRKMTEVKKLHAGMVIELSKWISPVTDYWRTFRTSLEAYLEPAYLCDVKDNDMSQICKCLMSKGLIDYGNYTVLREIVNDIHVGAATVIDETMKKLEPYRMSPQ